MVGQVEWMTDELTDRQTSRWNHIWVDRQTSHATDIQMDLSWYGRWTQLGIHLNHTCDVTSSLSTEVVVVV